MRNENMKKSTFSIVIALFVLLEASATLRISEICPRPSQPDSNGKESGWIELVNTGDEEINLSDYALVRWNRGKENKKKNRQRFVSRSLKAGERTVVYTSEAYPNYRIGEKAADYGGMMVFPFKIPYYNYFSIP